MCGVAGFLNFPQYGAEVCRDMTDSLAHRGPDDSGIEAVSVGKLSGWFGHRRLAVLDLSPAGHQPMTRGKWTVVFNGELYNFREIAAQLRDRGYQFSTHCDTEVLCQALNEWGIEALDHFDGMFAFAATNGESLYLARDRWGVKPLYYYLNNEGIAFASEMQALEKLPGFERRINLDAYHEYLMFGYISAPRAIYCNTFKLANAHFLEWKNGAIVRNRPFWQIDLDATSTFQGTEEEAVEQLDELLRDSVCHRLIADTPIGTFLSGGIDSTLISAMTQEFTGGKLQTFSIGFEETAYNEAPYARAIAEYLGTNHHEYTMSVKELFEYVNQIPEICGEPFFDSSLLPMLLLSRNTRPLATVVLSGDGGDEHFGGYLYYRNFDRIVGKHNMLPGPLRCAIGKLLTSVSAERGRRLAWRTLAELHTFNSGVFSYQDFDQIAGKRYLIQKSAFYRWGEKLASRKLSGGRIWQYLDQVYYMNSVLTKVDRASMHYSLEVRTPLLARSVTEFANTLPDSFMVRDGDTKFLLKKLLEKYVPRHLWEREKKGFGIPLASWLQNELRENVKELLFSGRAENENPFLNFSYARTLFNSLCDQSCKNREHSIWALFIFELWRRQKKAYFN